MNELDAEIERASLERMTSDEILLNVSRYIFAKNYVKKSKVCLDIACGEGYGLTFLREAKLVVAADISLEALKKAKIHAPYAELVRCDAHFLPFKEDTFDVITSFETIEHLNTPEKFLSELKRICKSSGVIIISTPNKLYKNVWVRNINPYHIREYTIEEFKSLLSSFFEDISMFVQVPKFSRWIKDNIIWTIRKIIVSLPHPLASKLLEKARNVRRKVSDEPTNIDLYSNHQYRIKTLSDNFVKVGKPQTIIAVVNVKNKNHACNISEER